MTRLLYIQSSEEELETDRGDLTHRHTFRTEQVKKEKLPLSFTQNRATYKYAGMKCKAIHSLISALDPE
jgi:hypothetical protein